MSSRFSRRGHINTSASDGRPLQIVYIHEEYDRKQHKVFDEVHALCQFAAAMTRGDLDVTGKAPHPDARPCDVIMILASNHISTSDNRQHISVGISKAADINSNPVRYTGTYHVYCINGIPKQGHAGWCKWKGSKTKKATQSAILADLAAALANDFQRSTPSKTPSPPSSGPVGFKSDGQPIYYSVSRKIYYYEGSDGNQYQCDAPGSSSRGSPSNRAGPSTTNSSQGQSSSNSSGSNPRPIGYSSNGTPYYYSRSQGMYYHIDPATGAKKRYIVPKGSQPAQQQPSGTATASQAAGESKSKLQPAGYQPNNQPYYWSTSLNMHYVIEADGTKRRYHP